MGFSVFCRILFFQYIFWDKLVSLLNKVCCDQDRAINLVLSNILFGFSRKEFDNHLKEKEHFVEYQKNYETYDHAVSVLQQRAMKNSEKTSLKFVKIKVNLL